MSLIPALEPAATTANVKANLDKVQKALGGIPNMARVMANAPATLDAYVLFSGAASQATLNARARSAIALAVANANGCDYCVSAHTSLAAKIGESHDAKTEAAVKLALALITKHGDVTADDRGSLSPAEVLDTITVTVLNVFTNYVNKVADTEVDFPIVRSTR